MPDFNPTEEQEKAVEAFATGEDMVISAYAGSGKTATLSLLAEQVPDDKLAFLAFNKSIATDAAKKFPKNTDCKTAHSHAYRAVGKNYVDRLNGPKVYAKQHAQILGIRSGLEIGQDMVLSPYNLASKVAEAVRNFCYSAELEPSEMHVPYVAGADMTVLREYIAPLARKMWADKQSKTGRCAFTHDDYFKIWSLSDPKLPYDAIQVDEAQDSNPALISVVKNQRHAQKVIVGDSNQAIYAWRGAVDAMNFPAQYYVHLTQSFRFGPAVAEEANKWLTLLGNEIPLRGFEKIDSKLVVPMSEPDAVLCRTNAEAVSQAMAAGADGKKYAIVGGTDEIKKFAESAMALMAGDTFGIRHPDLIAFKNWTQVREFIEEEGAGDLKVMVRLIDNYGPEAIIEVADNATDERNAQIIISTAHKAKGREWHKVKIASDFKEPVNEDGSDGELNRPEMMLAYVSVTRAQLELDNTGLDWVNRWINKEQEEKNVTVEEPTAG